MTVSPRNPTSGVRVTIVPKLDEGYEVDQVIVTDKNGKPVEVRDNGNGTYSFTQPAGKVTIRVILNDTTEIPFEDVPAGSSDYDAVQWAAENGITNGTSSTTFSPDGDCTRIQNVIFLYRCLKK